MSFYLLPPEGIAPYHKLEEYGLTRLHFLLRLMHCRDGSEVNDVIQDAYVIDHSDCLINGTAKDNISHYILRLLIGGYSETAAFYYESETAYFKLQLERMDKEELTFFFQYLEKTLIKLKVPCCYKSPLSNLLSLVQVLKEMFSSWAQVAESLCDENCNVSVCLPFHMALCLVAGRMVDLSKGMVTVPLRFMREVLLQQYQTVMKAFIQEARTAREIAIKDQRIKRLAAVFKQAYKSVVKSSIDGPKYCQPLSLPSLFSNAPMFPPCMNQLMKVLRQCHRLKHHDRIQLTLFLKELGLPLHDALLLWKHEYSKHDSVGSHKGWVGNEKRYIYNIRHLYGHEGGRINYRAHSCHFIQGRSLTLGDYGGCPFVVKDKTVLSSLTEEMGLGLHDIPVFERLIESQDYTAACQLYMLLKKLLMVKEDNFKSTQNNHFREQANKNVSVVQEHKVDNTPHTSIKLYCTQPGKDQRAASAQKHSINQSVFLNSAEGNVEMMYDNLKSSKLKSCSCTLENDTADKLSGSTIDIALKIRLSKSYTHPDDVSPDDASLTEPNCCPDDLLTAGHSSHTSALIKKTLATETSVNDTLCCEPRDAHSNTTGQKVSNSPGQKVSNTTGQEIRKLAIALVKKLVIPLVRNQKASNSPGQKVSNSPGQKVSNTTGQKVSNSPVDGQSRSIRCQSREESEPNLSDESCTTYLVCSNYTGQLRRCQGGRQYDFKSRSCRADSAVFCNAQRRSRSRSASNTTSAPQTENTTVSASQATRANTLLTILNALFPQQANNNPGIVGLQANNNPGIVGLQGNAPGIVPGVPQGFIGFPPGALPPADGGIGLFGAQGVLPQNQVPFINLLGNNGNVPPVAAGFNVIPRQIIQTAGIPGLGRFNNFQGAPVDSDLFGWVLEQNVDILNLQRQRAKSHRGPQYPALQTNGFSMVPLNQRKDLLVTGISYWMRLKNVVFGGEPCIKELRSVEAEYNYTVQNDAEMTLTDLPVDKTTNGSVSDVEWKLIIQSYIVLMSLMTKRFHAKLDSIPHVHYSFHAREHCYIIFAIWHWLASIQV
ncbi:hypothetical protein Btru_054436 [Bulinus truncatus]|nr:hypothetical protein Btru_054436 [Bulinus truncatus]